MLIRLKADHLPGDRDPKPVWLWFSRTGMTGEDVNLRWQAFLRRFDLEHTVRLFKQTLGWTVPKVRDPHTADLWTWLIIGARTQLRLARPLAEDLRRPWERPTEPCRLIPACPCPSGVSPPPREGPPSRWRAPTLPARARTPTRLKEPQVSNTTGWGRTDNEHLVDCSGPQHCPSLPADHAAAPANQDFRRSYTPVPPLDAACSRRAAPQGERQHVVQTGFGGIDGQSAGHREEDVPVDRRHDRDAYLPR